MLSIYKYPFKIADRVEIELPPGAVILDVQLQGDAFQLWALVDEDSSPSEKASFLIVGTGHPLPKSTLCFWEHWKTVQQDQFVWHILRQRKDTTGR